MDFRAKEYIAKLFNEEFEKTLEKKIFNLGVAWGYYALAECVADSFGGDKRELVSGWLNGMRNDKMIGEYIEEILALTGKEMTPSEKIMQNMNRRYCK